MLSVKRNFILRNFVRSVIIITPSHEGRVSNLLLKIAVVILRTLRSLRRFFVRRLRRTNDIDYRLAFFDIHRFEAALEGGYHFARLGDFFTVTVGDLHRFLVIRDAI